jgi:hypothetical protein
MNKEKKLKNRKKDERVEYLSYKGKICTKLATERR